jgi:hypothetical protein
MAQGYTKGLPLDIDGTLSANSDAIVPSQKAVKAYVDANSGGGGGGGGGTTTNALTINNSGSGDASGATYNGSAAVTISYNTIGAQASNSNLTNLAGLTYASTSFVKMTGANTFTLDTTVYAPLASPTFTGTPAAPTPTANDNSTKLATTAYVDSAVSAGGGITFNQVQRIAFLKI